MLEWWYFQVLVLTYAQANVEIVYNQMQFIKINVFKINEYKTKHAEDVK